MTQIHLPILNFADQQQIFSCPSRIVTTVKGRRFGFTKGAANNTIKVALTGAKKKGLWVDTVNSNIERYLERYFIPVLRKLPPHLWAWRKQQKILQIRDFYMDFRSADTPENIEGFEYDYLVLNEAGIILKDAYLWQNAIRPMMWNKECQAYIGGTPKGAGGEFEKLFNRGMDKTQEQYAAFRFSTFDNPYHTASVVAAIKNDMKDMPERVIQQEIYAQFLEDTGIVFRGVSAVAILPPDDARAEPKTDHLYVMGVDLAKVQDFTVISVYDRTNNEEVFQMRFNQLDWGFQKARIREVCEKYNSALIMLDATGLGDPIADDLARMGLPVQPIHLTNEQKKQMIEKLSNWIELRRLKMLNLEETIREFNQFTYDISEKTDRVFYGAPAGFHDDIVISHALAIWSLQPITQKKPEAEMTAIERDYLEKTQGYHGMGDLEEYQDDYTDETDVLNY